MCLRILFEAVLTFNCKVTALVFCKPRVREAIVVTGSHGGEEGELYSKWLFMIGYAGCYASPSLSSNQAARLHCSQSFHFCSCPHLTAFPPELRSDTFSGSEVLL